MTKPEIRWLPTHQNLYHYKAICRSVYDADTIRADIDLGFDTWVLNKSIRLRGIDAPEVRGKNRIVGIEARDALRELISGEELILQVNRGSHRGKYGRYIAEVWCSKEGESVNNWLVKSGYAVRVNY